MRVTPFQAIATIVIAILMLAISFFAMRRWASADQRIVQIGHSDPLENHWFSQDGKRLFTVDAHSVILWNGTTGTKLAELAWADQGYVSSIRESSLFQPVPDSDLILVGSELWDLREAKPLRSLTTPQETLGEARISPDGREAIMRLDKGRVAVAMIDTGERTTTLSPENYTTPVASNARTTSYGEERVIAVSFGEQGPRALLGVPKTKEILVWDVRRERPFTRFTPEGREAWYDGAQLSPSGRFFVTRNWDDTGSSTEKRIIRDSETSRKILELQEPWQRGDSIVFLPDERYCVTGIGRKVAELWSLEGGEKVREFAGHQRAIYAIDVRENGRVLETRSRDRAILWDVGSGRRTDEFRHPGFQPINKQISDYRKSDGGMFVTPGPEKKTLLACSGVRLQMVDVDSGRPMREFIPPLPRGMRHISHNVAAQSLNLTPGGRTALVTYHHQSHHLAVLWDLHTGHMLRRITETPVPERAIQWSPDGRSALTSPPGSPVRMWNVERGRPSQTIGYEVRSGVYHPRSQVEFSKNGKYIFTQGGGLFLWDAESGEPLHQQLNDAAPRHLQGLFPTAAGPDYYQGRSARSPGGEIWASQYAGYSGPGAVRPHPGQVILWNVERAEQLHRLARPGLSPIHLEFSPDGRRIAVTYKRPDTATEVSMWDVESGNLLSTFGSDGAPAVRFPHPVSFTPSGDKGVFNPGTGDLYVWEVTSGALLHTLRNTAASGQPAGTSTNPPAVLMAPDGRHLLAQHDNLYATLWNLETARPAHVFETTEGSTNHYLDFAFSGDGRRLLSSERRAGDIINALWDLERGCQRIDDADLHDKRKYPIGWDKSGYWKTRSHGRTVPVSLFDSDTGRTAFSFHAPLQTSPTGDRAIGRSGPRLALCLWDLETGEPIASLEQDTEDNADLTSLDQRAASGAWDATIGDADWRYQRLAILHRRRSLARRSPQRYYEPVTATVWDMRDGQPLMTEIRHGGPRSQIFAVLFTPDGSGLFTASRDGTAILWDIASRTKRRVYEGVPWNAVSLRLTDDARKLIIRSRDGSFKFWDVADGNALRQCYLLHHGNHWMTVNSSGQASGTLRPILSGDPALADAD